MMSRSKSKTGVSSSSTQEPMSAAAIVMRKYLLAGQAKQKQGQNRHTEQHTSRPEGFLLSSLALECTMPLPVSGGVNHNGRVYRRYTSKKHVRTPARALARRARSVERG